MPNEARGLCGRSCEISSQYDQDTSFSKGSIVKIYKHALFDALK